MSKIYYQTWLMLCCLLLSSNLWAQIKEYHLHIAEQKVNITGKEVNKITVNGQFPAPTLSFEEGDEAVIHVYNDLREDSSIHWHGLLLPGLMDGVPGFNQYQGIAPQKHFEYRFKIRQNGTYWYHAHSKGQEQDGLYGAFIVYPKEKTPIAVHEETAQDYVVMLSDFHESNSQTIMNNLKKSHVYYQNQQETVADVWRQFKRDGLVATWQDRKMWNQMRMLKTDLSDVTGYTFLINGKTPTQNWTGLFQPQDKIRLRFINASAMSFFDVRIPNLKMTVVSADGQPVQPISIDEFRIGAAETYDVIVEPIAGHYQIEAESIDRTGFALGTLHQQGQPQHHDVHIPQARPRAVLNMADMGMQHEHNEHKPDQAIDHESIQQNKTEHHHDVHHSNETMQHQQHSSFSDVKTPVEGWGNASTPLGHYALQYTDLKSLIPQADTREAEREIVVRLGGNMERYIWTINGKKFNESQPFQVKYGERVRIKFINESMMAHPMHLHGMFMQLENGQEIKDLPNKHTIVVPPYQTVTALLTADEMGEWALHCHLLYHMSAGMMGKFIVANVADTPHPTTITTPKGEEAHVHH